jgi:hypothetical protein
VPELAYGGSVKTERVTSDLPDGWRELVEGEIDTVTPPLLKLGLEDLTGCWTAIRPRAGAQPDVMVTCPRKLHVGVVDEHSFAAQDELVRNKLFGPLDPGTMVALGDRNGFLYAPRDGLAMGAAPDGEWMSVTWALGEGPLAEDVRAAVASSVFPEPHAVTSGDQASYWLQHRWDSPLVLGPLCCLCGGGTFLLALVGGVVALRSRRRPADDDE